MKGLQEAVGAWAGATEAGKTQEAHAAAMQVLLMAGVEALKHPTPSLLLKQEADDLESQGDWAAAETVRRKILALEEPAGSFGLAKAQMDLSQLLRLVGRLDEAWQLAVAATALARRTELFPLVFMALANEAHCALDQGASPEALVAASEAVQVIEPGKLHEHMRARALTLHARCLLANHDAAGADLHLRLSRELLQPHAGDSMLPGTVGIFANWWEVKSGLAERQGDLEGALAAITRAIEFRRLREGPYALFALARALEELGRFSKATSDFAGEKHALTEAMSIRKDLKLAPSN